MKVGLPPEAQYKNKQPGRRVGRRAAKWKRRKNVMTCLVRFYSALSELIVKDEREASSSQHRLSFYCRI
jgi:hypothetical protein